MGGKFLLKLNTGDILVLKISRELRKKGWFQSWLLITYLKNHILRIFKNWVK